MSGYGSTIDRPLGVSVEEEQAVILRDQLSLMKNQLPVERYSDRSIQPGGFINSPQIHIDMPNVAADLAPKFRELLGAQRELASITEGLGVQGQLVLENARVQTGVLNNLEGHERRAVQQRNQALRQLSQGMMELSSVNRGVGRTNRSLASIDRGVGGVRYDISHLEDSLCRLMGDLGTGIGYIGDELVATRMAVVDALQEFQDIFLWSHREQMWVRKQTLEALQNPAQTAAYEAWAIAEKCRMAGDIQGALRMYKRSLDTNPAENRNYFSLGLIHLNTGDTEGAMDYFNTAASYSSDDLNAQAYYLMHLAKIEFFQKNFSKTKQLLEEAINLDVTNLEIWYDLALCSIKLGDKGKALYYVKNLLHANPKYGFKIIGNPEFASIMEDIRRILKWEA
ncbi:MAG: hypothetical protein US89_C0014G0019 [Candidatus Peregrinibacteria bacterium GW2011_GWF2_38_29]|nr:MAG: hypothetical protein US89_C0014G0019 [Candidatus Peregrinibacteria bacterium GW2011_GWF2_38_29]HBB02573.1 hypothetical protein [Candidatus Peregrinibacteria bacterium]